MKKIAIVLIVLVQIIFNMQNLQASENEITLSDYLQVIDKINSEYSSELYLLNEKQFLDSPIANSYDDYNEYITQVFEISLIDFEKKCLQIVQENEFYSSELNDISKSFLGTKTITFYSGRNNMTLTYKYTSNKFDTTYKPTVKVTKLNSTNFFLMSNYTGTFKNSNSTYSVKANGKIYTNYGVASNKSFTIDFNI